VMGAIAVWDGLGWVGMGWDGLRRACAPASPFCDVVPVYPLSLLSDLQGLSL
jgi:hypothetical protein